MSTPVRVVFLDIDGVVATSSSYKKARFVQGPWGGPAIDPSSLLSPRLVANVQRLCDVSGAVVVISSSWRTMHSLEHISAWLRSAGLTAPVIGATPDLGPGATRGDEIKAWMDAHAVRPKDVVILEDDEDVGPLRSRQVKPTFDGPHQGFTPRHVNIALRLFGIKTRR